MIKTITLLTMLFLSTLSISFAQTGGISGSVKTADGNPAELVSITIRGTSKGASTDKKGNFTIKNVKPGSVVIVASMIGLGKQEKTIDVRAGETATVDFTLSENSAQLQDVAISARNANKVNNIVAKMPLKKLENPQVYNSVSSEIIKQQGITNFDDAMRNVPGIARTWESTGRTGDGATYFALRGFEAQPSLYNGLPGFTSGDLDPADIEEIQVIKGPSGTLFGASFYGYGGIINTVTKKPYFTTGGEVTYNTGSFGLNRISADINTPLSKTEKIALRINTAYHSEGSFQDAGFKKSFFVAPALTYEVNDRLSFNFLAEILELERAVAPVFFHSNRTDPLTFKNVAELNLNNNLSFTSNELTIKNPRYNLQGQMNYKLSDQWTSQTVISRGTIKADGYYSYIYGNDLGSNEFLQSITRENSVTNTTDIQQNFNGDFKIGGLRNRLLVGLDYFTRNVVDNGTGYGDMRYVTPQGDISYPNPEHPVYTTRASVDSLLAGSGSSNSKIGNSAYSAYVSDVINITPALSAMLSLRADYFVSKGDVYDASDNYNQFALSPKFGLVYQPVLNKLSVFANYMNAFYNLSPSQQYDADGNPTGIIKSFKPENGNQLEFGIKTNLFEDKLSATVSFYDIKVKDRLYPDPVNINNSLQGGKVGSKGFEIDINANPFAGFNIIAGYSHNESKVLIGNPDGSDFYNEPGRAQGGQGPRDLGNLWATYKFISGSLKDFGLGLGGNYAGVYKVIDNSRTGVFELPSYTLLNASVFYNADRYRFTFNANNITNEKYYIGYWSINPQRPVNFSASFAFKF
jgi:iron complex outermembrane receptor protein